jgi:hypothetical protein
MLTQRDFPIRFGGSRNGLKWFSKGIVAGLKGQGQQKMAKKKGNENLAKQGSDLPTFRRW